ncbi:hypothetical protein [Sphingomonas psychrotolerans]|nr:hypothetical protein [Sphingomonas psychrotolerans]
MTRLLASFLVAFAMFFSPLAMEMGVGMAMAQTTASISDGGCAGMHDPAPEHEQKSGLKMNCAAACAAIPGTPATVRARFIHPKSRAAMVPTQALSGIRPEGETPPPRIASEI